MLNFKEWIVNESKFMQLDKDQQEDVDLIADKILKIVISKSRVEEDLYDLYTRTFIKKVLVGEIKRKDGRRPVPVYLHDYGDNNVVAYYNPKTDEIVMNVRSLSVFRDNRHFFINTNGRKIPSIVNALSHETIHAIDPKLNPQIINPENRAKKASEKKQFFSQGNVSSYYKSPEEFDAYGMGILSDIKVGFHDTDEQYKSRIISVLEEFLRTGNYDMTSNIINRNDYEALMHWKTKPTLWRKFQQRLFNLLQELKKEKAAQAQRQAPAAPAQTAQTGMNAQKTLSAKTPK